MYGTEVPIKLHRRWSGDCEER